MVVLIHTDMSSLEICSTSRSYIKTIKELSICVVEDPDSAVQWDLIWDFLGFFILLYLLPCNNLRWNGDMTHANSLISWLGVLNVWVVCRKS
jgi:hypothetical protein